MSTDIAKDQSDALKNLIDICRDGQAGYLIAAEHARNSELRTFFTSQSMERARFAAELENAARHMGLAELSHISGIVERINRAWLDLKPRLGTGDAGVLETVEADERRVADLYTETLQVDFPPELHRIIENQQESISAAYDQVCSLRSMGMGGRAA
jgi:uncharacterized protein (TIGR02284 family)